MSMISNIQQHPLFQKSLAFFDQALVSGSNFLLGILLVRGIGLKEYGVYALLWMGVFFALGINQAFITKPLLSIAPALEKNQQDRYLQDLKLLQIALGLLGLFLGMLLYFCSSYFFDPSVSALLPAISGIIFCQLQHDFHRKINFLQNKFFQVLLLDGLLYGGQLFLVIGLSLKGQLSLSNTLQGLLILHLIATLWGSIAVPLKQAQNIKDVLIRHFHFSKWLLGTSLLQWLSGNYFIIVGASILGTTAIGAIRMVQNIMGLCHVLFLTMENIIPIEAARQYHLEGENALTRYLADITWKTGLAFGLLLLALAFFSSPLLQALYGSAAVEYTYIMLAYVVLYALVFIGHPFRFLLRTIEKTQPIFVAYVLGSIFSMLFAKILLTSFAMNGLLFGLIATQFITVLTYCFFTYSLPTQTKIHL